MSTDRTCDDCGDDIPKDQRRRKCSHCGLMVCGWCDHHTHALGRELAKRAAQAATVPSCVVTPRIAIPWWCLAVLCSGCMVSTPQPGQTPVQVQACTNNATVHNIAVGAAGALAGVGAGEGSIAVADPGDSKGLAIAGIVTGVLAGTATIVAEVTGQAYATQGCAPALAAERAKP